MVATVAAFLAALMAALLLAPSSAVGGKTTQLDLALCAPDENTFNLDIDNPFFPLPVGQQWIYSGQEQGQTIGLQITVLDATESFYSGQDKVNTGVVEELEWEDADGDGVVDGDEFVIEVSLNYYAQTLDGTVCYFGEDVRSSTRTAASPPKAPGGPTTRETLRGSSCRRRLRLA